MQYKGIKKASGVAKDATPFKLWVQLSLDTSTGELLTDLHTSSDSWTKYDDRNIYTIIHTDHPMTMREIQEYADMFMAEYEERTQRRMMGKIEKYDDGWHNIRGYDVYVEDGIILRGKKKDGNLQEVTAHTYVTNDEGGYDKAKLTAVEFAEGKGTLL